MHFHSNRLRFYHIGRLLFMSLDDHQLLLVRMNTFSEYVCLMPVNQPTSQHLFAPVALFAMHFCCLLFFFHVCALLISSSDFVRVELVFFCFFFFAVEHMCEGSERESHTLQIIIFKNLFSDICPIKSSPDNAIYLMWHFSVMHDHFALIIFFGNGNVTVRQIRHFLTYKCRKIYHQVSIRLSSHSLSFVEYPYVCHTMIFVCTFMHLFSFEIDGQLKTVNSMLFQMKCEKKTSLDGIYIFILLVTRVRIIRFN